MLSGNTGGDTREPRGDTNLRRDPYLGPWSRGSLADGGLQAGEGAPGVLVVVLDEAAQGVLGV